MWCWRRLLRVMSFEWCGDNRLMLKEINPEYSLEGLMLKLKLQYFVHLMQNANSLEKTDAGKYWWQEKKRATEDEMVEWHHWITLSLSLLWILFLEGGLSPLHLVDFLRFYLVLSSGAESSAFLFCLIFSNCGFHPVGCWIIVILVSFFYTMEAEAI